MILPVQLPSELHRRTAALVEALNPQEDGPPPDLACAEGAQGRFRLRARRSQLAGRAELRAVVIEGTSASIFNCLIFPEERTDLPVFVAELLVAGGSTKLLFVDLQTPGLSHDEARRVAGLTRPLDERHRRWRSDEPAPGWALEFSGGHASYVRPTAEEVPPVTDIYCEFLQCWVGLATGQGRPADEPRRDAVRRFKDHHVESSPVAGYLARVFGEGWTARFLTEFLYR